MTENETQDEMSADDKAQPEYVEGMDRENFELDNGKESGESGGEFRMGGPSVDPYADEAQTEKEPKVDTKDTE